MILYSHDRYIKFEADKKKANSSLSLIFLTLNTANNRNTLVWDFYSHPTYGRNDK